MPKWRLLLLPNESQPRIARPLLLYQVLCHDLAAALIFFLKIIILWNNYVISDTLAAFAVFIFSLFNDLIEMFILPV